MKKKAVVGSVAALVLGMSLCSYQLGRFQAMEEQKNRVSYIEDSQSVQTTVAEQLTPDQVSAKENIDAEQIVVKITDHYVTSHGDHFHYYNGKVPFDAIFSEELVMKDPNYVLQDSHIINEVQDGYVIKVDGKYYLYLKDPSKHKNVRSKEEVERQKESLLLTAKIRQQEIVRMAATEQTMAMSLIRQMLLKTREMVLSFRTATISTLFLKRFISCRIEGCSRLLESKRKCELG